MSGAVKSGILTKITTCQWGYIWLLLLSFLIFTEFNESALNISQADLERQLMCPWQKLLFSCVESFIHEIKDNCLIKCWVYEQQRQKLFCFDALLVWFRSIRLFMKTPRSREAVSQEMFGEGGGCSCVWIQFTRKCHCRTTEHSHGKHDILI